MPENMADPDVFVPFPHTPHIAWLTEKPLREDKLLNEEGLRFLFDGEVEIEEKIDGANLGISFNRDGDLLVQHRGGYVNPPCEGEYNGLAQWIGSRKENLFDELEDRFVLFGEWCRYRHSIPYDRLPDYLIGFDVFDRRHGFFVDTMGRDPMLARVGISKPCIVDRGVFSVAEVISLLQEHRSCYRTSGPAEGLYVRRSHRGSVVARGKLVNPAFTQSIESHWSRGSLVRNTAVFDHGS